ncbi:MAG: hypothetical protein V2I34_05545 [Bacteroidales bacterium]|jgi:hypothetical protein|nr:hypothetical protein [Bacteroidales bacterium]
MEYLIKKLNYKEQERICILNANNGFIKEFENTRPSVRVDREIDPKYLYEFCLVFVRNKSELTETVPQSIHNLAEDGVLWFAYPKMSSKKYNADINRDSGWELVNSHGFEAVRQVSVDEDWSALRFRNVKHIKRSKG